MTAPNQKIFNLNLFKAPADNADGLDQQDNTGGSEKKEYPVIGNASRDQVRKLIFECFQSDRPIPGEKLSISQIIEQIENCILEECKDPKSKQYREKSRLVLLKLKGLSFEQSRNDLRMDSVSPRDFIKDDYVPRKQQAQTPAQQRVGSAPMAPGGFAQRPPMMGGPGAGPRPMMPVGMRPPGPAGPMMRPRMPTPNLGAPRPPFIPIQAPVPIQEKSPVRQEEVFQEQPAIEQIAHIPEQTPLIQPSVSRKQSQQSVSPDSQRQNTQTAGESEQKEEFTDERSVSQFNAQQNQVHNHDTSLNSSTIIQDNIQTSIDDGESSNLGQSQKKAKKIKKKKKKAAPKLEEDPALVSEHHQINTEEQEHLEDGLNQELDTRLRVQAHQQPAQQYFDYQNMIDQNSSFVNEEHGLRGVSSEALHLMQDQPSIKEQEGGNFLQGNSQVHQDQEIEEEQAPSRILNEEENVLQKANDEAIQNIVLRHEVFETQVVQQEIAPIIQQRKLSIDQNLNLTQQSAPPHREMLHSSSDEEHEEEKLSVVAASHPLIPEQTGAQQQREFVSHIRGTSQGHHKPQSVNSVTTLSHEQQTEPLKRLQDSLTYKRAQKKELTERLVSAENEKTLFSKKAQLLIEENKQLQNELRIRDRELQKSKVQAELNDKQAQLQVQTLERQLRDKNQEIEQLKKEVARRKEKEEKLVQQSNNLMNQFKERYNQHQQESQQQLNYSQNLLRQLEQRIASNNNNPQQQQIPSGGGVSAAIQSTSNNNEGAGASNYQQQELMMESVQKEMREMKQQYDARIRELNEELQNRMRNLQRVERQNVHLQEKNIKLNNMVQNMEVQQLSTVAGSGSNQRDAASLINHFGGPGSMNQRRSNAGEIILHEQEEDSMGGQQQQHQLRAPMQMMRQGGAGGGGNRNQQQFIMGEDEGTGGFNQHREMIRMHAGSTQEYHGYGGGGEELGVQNAAAVVGTGSGGGVGTTSAALFSDNFDDDDGSSFANIGDNQLRNGGGAGGSVHRPNLVDAIGSGGAHPDNDLEEGEEDEEEDVNEDQDDDGEEENEDEADDEEQDDDYDVLQDGYYEGGSNGNERPGAGVVEVEDYIDGEEGALDEEGENEHGQDNNNNEDNLDEDGGHQRRPNRSGGAAHVLNSGSGGVHQHNFQGHHGEAQRFGAIFQGHGQSQQQQFSQNFQQEDELYPAGGSRSSSALHSRPRRTANNEERKQGGQKGQRRGNRQQNQQHTNVAGNATGSGGSSNMQNPRYPRNSRGRQLRSNQQHVVQQQTNQAQQFSQSDQQPPGISGASLAPNVAPPSSQVVQRISGSQQEYFQSFGDSSSHYNNNNREQSAQSATHLHHQLSGSNLNPQFREGAAGGGVVHTVGRQAPESMMSAESGSTALLDRNLYHRNNQAALQSSGVARQSQAVQHIQTGSNNNQIYTGQSSQANDIFDPQPSSTEPPYAAAVTAPPQSRAAAPRQRQQQNNQQHSAGGTLISPQQQHLHHEEVKQVEVPSAASTFYSNNNQVPPPPVIRQGGQGGGGLYHHHQSNQFMMLGGSSGEQEEDSVFSAAAASGGGISGVTFNNQFGAGGSGAGNSYERGRQRPRDSQQQHLDQSLHSANARNDSRKTSGANTPNKDGADTPTTKAYRNQQQQNSIVHNLTSSHLFFNSNQDENGGDSNPFMPNSLNQQFGVRGAQGGNNSGQGPTIDTQVINANLFD